MNLYDDPELIAKPVAHGRPFTVVGAFAPSMPMWEVAAWDGQIHFTPIAVIYVYGHNPPSRIGVRGPLFAYGYSTAKTGKCKLDPFDMRKDFASFEFSMPDDRNHDVLGFWTGSTPSESDWQEEFGRWRELNDAKEAKKAKQREYQRRFKERKAQAAEAS